MPSGGRLFICVVVPAALWQKKLHMKHQFSSGALIELWYDQNVWAKHELRRQIKSIFVVWELQEHHSHHRDPSHRHLVHLSVQIVAQRVPQVDRLADNFSDLRYLRPGFSFKRV